jgi:hypothetical protein
VGVDFYIRPGGEARTSGVDPHFHCAWALMELVETLLDRAGVLNTEDRRPILPPNAEALDEEDYERVRGSRPLSGLLEPCAALAAVGRSE